VVDLALPLRLEDVVHGAPDLTRLSHHLPVRAHARTQQPLVGLRNGMNKVVAIEFHEKYRIWKSICCKFPRGTHDRF
jgi:hypothetical protein